jgi:hypothetical protein
LRGKQHGNNQIPALTWIKAEDALPHATNTCCYQNEIPECGLLTVAKTLSNSSAISREAVVIRPEATRFDAECAPKISVARSDIVMETSGLLLLRVAPEGPRDQTPALSLNTVSSTAILTSRLPR